MKQHSDSKVDVGSGYLGKNKRIIWPGLGFYLRWTIAVRKPMFLTFYRFALVNSLLATAHLRKGAFAEHFHLAVQLARNETDIPFLCFKEAL